MLELVHGKELSKMLNTLFTQLVYQQNAKFKVSHYSNFGRTYLFILDDNISVEIEVFDRTPHNTKVLLEGIAKERIKIHKIEIINLK